MQNNDITKNMITGTIYQMCNLLVGFLIRKYLVDNLGVYNLGVIGVFENVINMMSLLDFGVGSACMYYFYRAFAKNDREQVSYIYVLFRKSYRIVSLGLAVVGCIILLNIGLIIDVEENKTFLQLTFGLFLLKAILNHLLICPRTCLQCDGKRYVGSIADTFSMIAFAFIKAYFLEKTGNVLIYLSLLTLELIVSTLYIVYYFNKEYKDIDFKSAKVDQNLKNDILKYSKSLAISNINYYIYSSTDNIVLSKFCGTLVVGYMSNYYMIVNAVKGFVTQITNSVEASFIKNYSIESSERKDIYNFNMFFCFCIASFVSICLYHLTDSFIYLYFGKDFVMEKEIILFMTIVLSIILFKNPSSNFVISNKMKNKEVPFAIAMMISNVFLSILFSINMGAKGVLLGTLVSESILWIGDEIMAFRSNIGLGWDTIKRKFIYIVLMIIEYIIPSYFLINVSNYLDWLINAFICVAVFITFTFLFIKTKEFKQLANYLLKKKS